jgi:hypothetical protein
MEDRKEEESFAAVVLEVNRSDIRQAGTPEKMARINIKR